MSVPRQNRLPVENFSQFSALLTTHFDGSVVAHPQFVDATDQRSDLLDLLEINKCLSVSPEEDSRIKVFFQFPHREVGVIFVAVGDDVNGSVLDIQHHHIGNVDQSYPLSASRGQPRVITFRSAHLFNQCIQLFSELAKGIGLGTPLSHKAIKSFAETLLANRLQQVIGSVDFKRFERETVISCHKNYQWSQFRFQGSDDFKSAQARHLNVEQDQFRTQRFDHFDGFQTVLGIADDFYVGPFLQHAAQAY